MEKPDSSVDKNLKEQRSHGDYSFPVEIRTDSFSTDPRIGTPGYPFHWHPEIEFSLLLTGQLKYQINATEYTVETGEGLFINSNSLHAIYCLSEKALTLSVIFHPRFLYGHQDSREYEKYIAPIIESADFPSYPLKTTPEGICRTVPALLERCLSLFEQRKPAWELHVKGNLLSTWGCLYSAFLESQTQNKVSVRGRHTAGQAKAIMQYIQENYASKITLADIADAAALSPGECGRICKKLLHQTPFEYLNTYRIEQSIPDLLKKELSITEIALKNGFSSSSYYAETFKTVKGISPTRFRQNLK